MKAKPTAWIFFAWLLIGCAGPEIPSADGPIPETMALIGETRNQRSLADYEWLLFEGVDRRSLVQSLLAKPPFLKENKRFYQVPAGRHKIYARVKATTTARPPLLLDQIFTFDNVELTGGGVYIINGQRDGDVFDVWIEDYRTREHITSAVKMKPGTHGFRLWKTSDASSSPPR